jgi:hypothetical protein
LECRLFDAKSLIEMLQRAGLVVAAARRGREIS